MQEGGCSPLNLTSLPILLVYLKKMSEVSSNKSLTMNTTIKSLLFVLSISALSLTSCQKHSEEPEAQSITLDVQIAANETYTYNLPEGMDNQSPVITTQSGTFDRDQLSSDSRTYTYVPKTDYTGTDQVVISVKDEGHHGKRKPHLFNFGKAKHGCHGGGERVKQVTINLTIGQPAVNVKG